MSRPADNRLHLPAGSSARGAYEFEITPQDAGWDYSSLRIVDLAPGGVHRWSTGGEEMMVLPLTGGCTVTVESHDHVLIGRDSVFSRVTDCLYLPRDTEATMTSGTGGRFAFPGARCARRLQVRYRAAEDISVELRGAGSASRQVNNFCSADSFAAERLIAVEVLTPAGNFSSYPPHKHDEHRPGVESELEEIYYFEVSPTADAPAAAGPGFAYHRVYGRGDRPVEVLAEVRDRDAVLVPHGWHGPSIAAPGYDLYYLNVMAGPSPERDWQVCDDPDHGWVRDSWAELAVDPRLPMTSSRGVRS